MISEKLKIITDDLLPTLTENIENCTDVTLSETKELVEKISKLDSEEVVLLRAMSKLRKNNEQLEEAIPQIDDQIAQAEKLLEDLETFDVDAD